MDQTPRWKYRFKNFDKAFHKLSMIVEKKTLNEIEQMALIQAFEFTLELGWKTMRDYLLENGFEVRSPKDAIRQAFLAQYIDDGDIWMEAIDKRNESSHTYDDVILLNTVDFIVNEFYRVAEKFDKDFTLKFTTE
ncbi:MAG TPA: HI0074 family nucleotidyltransferase substrate-binding subunit [Candidatus Kapabacteria bacterium]|nr:HI0074 family nucleotidyltransferase substrate-binding subunit [Candidatus Kapabacteria bacterium]